MNRNPHNVTDIFIDWLDAFVDGKSTSDIETETDSELSAMRAAACQFHGLDQRSTRNAASVLSRNTSWEQVMSTHSISPTPPEPHVLPDRPFLRNLKQIGSWERVATALVVAAVILGTTFGFSRFSDSFGSGDQGNEAVPFGGFASPESGGNDESVIPVVTIPPGKESSNIPPPTADECVVTPMTREQVIEHLTEANVVTDPLYEESNFAFDERQVPSTEDAQAIMQTYREWTACGLFDRSWAYRLQFETPWFTAFNVPLFSETDPSRNYNPDIPPVSAQRIEEWTDIVLEDEMLWATPVNQFAGDTLENGAMPTIFPDEISIIGPDHAVAIAYWVRPETMKLEIMSPRYIEFVKIDGKWLLDASFDGGRG